MLEIAIDIGGTFTDIVCLQDQQRLCLAKVPTTPHDLVQGVQQGVARVLALAGQPATAVERFIHSTTIATNAILEQKGAITGVLMTAGFEDVLEIGQQKRSQMYDLFLDPETPSFLAPRRQRVGIRERLDAQGNVLQPLDELQVVQAVATLQQLYGPASGVIGGRFAGEQSHLRDLITLDIGGTSCDVALVREGKPLLSREGRIARYPLRVPMVDVSTVGAGGGSLAWLDRSGGLHVGPQSAGADPGPACYGRGGTVPTVTDASVGRRRWKSPPYPSYSLRHYGH